MSRIGAVVVLFGVPAAAIVAGVIASVYGTQQGQLLLGMFMLLFGLGLAVWGPKR